MKAGGATGGRRATRRILFVEANEDGTAGGSHQFMFDLVRSLDRSRFTPIVLFYQQNRFVELLAGEGIETRVWEAERRHEQVIPSGILRRPRQVWQLLVAIQRRVRFLKDERIDLVHLNNSPGVGFDDWLPAAHMLRRPCIVHAQIYFRPRRWLWGRLIASFDRVIAISDTVAAALRDTGVPSDRIVRIYHATDYAALPSKVRRSPAEVRGELGAGNGKMLVAMVGHLRHWKGQDVVLEALGRLSPDERAGLTVAFVGGTGPGAGPYLARLEAAVTNLDLEGCVAFLGERSDALDFMNAADVVLHASTMPEPFGIVVIEGMALGKAVVASRLGGPGEIITPGSGVTFDPENPSELTEALRELMSEPARRQELGKGALQRVRAFGIEENAAAVQRVYAELLADSDARRESRNRGSSGTREAR